MPSYRITQGGKLRRRERQGCNPHGWGIWALVVWLVPVVVLALMVLAWEMYGP